MGSSIILAANRLPATLVQINGVKQWQPSPGGMAAALTPVQKKWRAKWIGWSGLHEAPKDLPPFSEGLQGLHIKAELYDRYYNGIANGILWPAFHGLQAEPYARANWDAYKQVNNQFADAIAATAKPNDLIWVHDFHLLLLPALLRERGLKNTIGLFLHIPFVGRQHLTFPNVRELLSGLLAADICGVQTKRDARELLACLKAAFPKTSLPPIRDFPIGIDYDRYSNAHQQQDVQDIFTTIQQNTKDKHVVLSVSRLDYTKGIITQLRAVERAVKLGLKNTRYKLIVSPSREGVGAYQTLKKTIDVEVARLERELPGVVDYQYVNTPFAEICAWFMRADTALVTPLVDGMNLVAKEYLAAKPDWQNGVLVLSTQAGAAAQLDQALLVDSNDEAAIAQALLQAQTMPASERRRRAQAIRHNLQTQDVFWWAEQFLDALKDVKSLTKSPW